MHVYMYLPQEKAKAAATAIKNCMITELRLKPDEKIIAFADKPYFLSRSGSLSENAADGYILSREEFKRTFEKMCQNSVYARQENLRLGFLTLPGGHRVGVCGKTIVENGKVTALRDVSAVNIRISRQIFSAADNVIEKIAPCGKVKNTLIISPPGCGKTTVLREIARLLGGERYFLRVGIIDERCEIAAMECDKPQYNIGFLSFVYSDCPKAQGMMMALRSMSPDVLICDEVGGAEDVSAIFSLINGGVKIICSCHGYGRADCLRRGLLKELMEKNVFERIIVLSRRHGMGTIEEIY